MDPIVGIYIFMFFFGIYFLLLFLILYVRNKKHLYDYVEPEKFFPITIVTPVYNEAKAILDTLQAVIDMEYPKGKKQFIVVDDCSTDNTYEVIKEFAKKYSNVKIVQTPKNTGNAAGAKNYGLKFVKTPLVGFVDADSMPNKDSLLKMVGGFEKDKKFVAITSRVWVQKVKNNFIEKFQDFDYVVIAWGRKILDFIGCVYVTNGPLSIYRAGLMKKLGGFDEKNLTEDIELPWNLLSRGYKTGMSYSTKVYTKVPDNIKEWINQRIRWNVGGLQTLYKYRKFFLRHTENLFGYFIVFYVSIAFLFSLLGFILFARQLYFRFTPYVLSLPYYLQGYNPFKFIKYSPMLTLLFFFGMTFLVLSMFYYKFASKESDLKRRNIRTILIYLFIYRPLYIIPLIWSFVRILRGNIGWYTK
ncbi:MAG: glycosyltransferase family 2 protein [archaeon]